MYSLGITLYEMITGRPPFRGDAASVIAQHVSKRPTPVDRIVEDLPEDVNTLIMSMLEKDPEQRPTNMAAVTGRLQTWANAPREPRRAVAGE